MRKFFSLFAALTLSVGLWATNTTVADLAGLQTALASEVDTVFVSQTVSLPNETTINGNGKVISVLKPYMAETGMIAVESSDYSVFNVEGTVSIANATILGGSGDAWSNAGGINVNPGAQLTMENVTVARSYRGVYINGTAIMKNCDIVRNVCNFGGGILLADGGKLIMDGCSLSENRSLSDGGGGGAMEIQYGATLYANNTVIANNSSSEIGGAINLYSGTVYLTNCTISGNTNQTWYGARAGAGIGNNSGTLYAANCIFMNNTFFDPSTEEPTISDIGLYSGNNLTMINCIYGAVVNGTPKVITDCKVATNSDAVFAGYRQDGVFRLTNAQTPGFKHSILTRKEGGTFFSLYAPAQQFSGTGGVATYVDFSDINNIKMAYDKDGDITSLGGLNIEGLTNANKVTTYYEPGPRAVGVVGASAVDTRTFYTVKLIVNEHVSVKGVTVYGESYPEGTTVPISHTAEDGFYFRGWNLDMGGTPKYETSNPCNLIVNSDIIVYPQVAVDGAYTIFIDLPNKDYVFDVTSGSAQSINENGYAMNTQVTLQGARSGYKIEKWLDYENNELSTEATFTLTMDGDKNITPIWVLDQDSVTITVVPTEHCSVSGLPADGKCPKGSLITFTAEPELGYQLSYWEDGDGNRVTTVNPLVIIATKDTTINVKPIFEIEQRSYGIATGVTAQMGTLDKDYPWIKTTAKPGLAYMSTNKDFDGTESRDTLVITPEANKYYRLKFDYAVSSEEWSDKLSIWVNNVQIANQIFGEVSGSYDSRTAFLITPGQTATIVMSYGKDGGWAEGEDRGYIYNIQVTSCETPPAIYTVSVLNGEGGSVTGLAPQGKYFLGEDVSLTAVAYAGCKFIEWQDGNGNQISTANPLTFTITQDTTIKPIYQVEQRSYEIATGVTAQMGMLSKDYPWIKTTAKAGLAYMSTNKDFDGTESRDTLVITPEANKYYRLTFDYAVSSEEWSDKLSIWVNNVQIANQISGEVSGSYDSKTAFLIEPGQTATIVMSYGKDGGWAEGEDRGYIYNIQVTSCETPPTIYTVSVLNGEGGSVTGLASQGKYFLGEDVSLTAITYAGYEFKEWQDGNGNQISTANPLTFTITQDTMVKPIFKVEKRSFTIANGVTAQMGKLNKNYPWIKTTAKAGLAYMSTNMGQGYTESRDTLIVTPEDGVSYRLTFDYAVTSESGWDKMSVWVNNVQIANGISGSTSGSYDPGETLLTEPTTIVMSYAKDGSGNYGDDRGYIYNIVVTSDAPYPVYTRDVTDGSWGTLCLPWESIALEGGDFYDVLGTKHAEYGVALVELDESDQLTAGKPYVFKATSEQIKVTYNPITAVDDSVDAGNHIIGSFAGCTVPNGMYIIYNNMLYITDGSSKIGTNRAYFDVASMGAYNPATAPARVVFMGGRQAPTDNPSLHHSINSSLKVLKDGKYLINGQFVIIKDNKMYNAQGIEL